MEEDIKTVPKNYRPNSQEFKLTAIVKVEEHLRDILARLDIVETDASIHRIIEKVLYMHKKRGIKSKGYREECSAIVFCEY